MSYARLAHKLPASKSSRAPRNVIFFDTETQENWIDKETGELTIKLGCAVRTVRKPAEGFRETARLEFVRNADFCRWVESQCYASRRSYLVSHNIQFDIQVTGITRYLAQCGWIRTSLIMRDETLMATYQKPLKGHKCTRRCRKTSRGVWHEGPKTSITLLNNQQLFNVSLEELGDSVGIPKAKIDFAAASDAQLAAYCRNDVDIMIAAWNKWYSFLQDNKLGEMKLTMPSQAMTTFRHRFMRDTIYIHNYDTVTRLERKAFHGGRVECFALGEQRAGPYYYLDVNSMYPFVMRNFKVPVKLLKYYGQCTVREFAALTDGLGYIADCTLEIKTPALPVRSAGHLLFPVGRVRGAFTGPELENALRHGSLLGVHGLAVYDVAVPFADFVDYFYGQRRKFADAGDPAYAFFSKLILNSLYGKFGQRVGIFRPVGFNAKLPNGSGQTFDLSQGRDVNFRRLDGLTEIEIGEREGHNSFPAIAAYITALARVHLLKFIEQAGWDHVLYCDTDSLFVDAVGYRNLSNQISQDKIGYLKVQRTAECVTIYSPKSYQFGDYVRAKGISKRAQQVAPDEFEQLQFQGLRGAIRDGVEGKIIVHKVRRKREVKYDKGIILPDGRTAPFVFPLAPAGSSEK